jgi:transcription initiation factor TFIID subunit 8
MEDSDAHMELNSKPSPEDSATNAPTPVSESTAITTKKRSTPHEGDEEPATEPGAKRRRTEDYGLQTPPAEDIISPVLDTRPAFNDEPSHLLHRGAALVLEHVGFDGATKEALESFCGEIDSCKCFILALPSR